MPPSTSQCWTPVGWRMASFYKSLGAIPFGSFPMGRENMNGGIDTYAVPPPKTYLTYLFSFQQFMYLLNICSFKFKTWSNTWSRLFWKATCAFSRVQQSLKHEDLIQRCSMPWGRSCLSCESTFSFGRCIRCCPGSSRLTAYAFYQKATFPFQHFPEDCRAPFKQVICVLSEAVFKEVQFSKKQLWVRDAAFPKK